MALTQINAHWRRSAHKTNVHDALSQLVAWCGAPSIAGGSLIAGMLLAGLAASPLHCGPMCGGFVLGQVSDRMARLPMARLSECQRLRAASLPRYHLGRITTYMGLGALAGGGGLLINDLGGGAGVFLLLGAALLVAQAAHRLRPGIKLPLRGPLRGYSLGLVLGFLPCGVLYAAIAAAAATGSPWRGALAMLCFGTGTIPALVATGWFGVTAGQSLRRYLAILAPSVLVFNAALLTILGVRMLAGS
jgi:sulfite exporter TauE/SafE